MSRQTELKPGCASQLWRGFAHLVFAVLCTCGMAQAVQAQAINRYTNNIASAANGISNTVTPCTNPLKRTFSVATSYLVSDVNIGVLAAHTYRQDLTMTLVSPSGTRVIVADKIGGSSDNFNALLDDSGLSPITNYTASDTITTVPPYNATFQPNNALSAFNGLQANGTWTLEICDNAAQDSGTFYQADLYLTSAPTNFADLSLTKTVSNAAPSYNSSITYTLTATNSAASNLTTSGVTVRDMLPTGASFSSYSGSGSYSSSTGDWLVGTLAPGQSKSLTITATVTGGAGLTVTNSAEITSSSVVDLDSTPNNGVSGEDDYASASFTVSGTNTAGTAPTLTCSAGSSQVNWDVNTWSAGLRSNSYAITGLGTVTFDVTTTGSSDPTLSGQPVTSTTLTGGAATPQNNLYLGYDFTTRSQDATIKMTLPSAVPGAQFRIFDVDYGANSWADHITVTGTLNGTTVLPTLTNGVSNSVVGNEAFGIAGSSNTQSNGNLTVTFSSAVDTVYIRYGNYSAAPADPQGQVIGLDDITLCKPVASIGVTKISSAISDPTNGTTNPKAIPGAVIEYCILITNSGTATLTNIAASDPLPANFTYAAGTMTSGSNCSTATTAEDDNNLGADESDPFGAAISGTTLTATAASLSSSSSFALKFRGTVN